MIKKIYVIAEAGVNHNGDLDKAFSLVDAAVAAGADAVKFQTFKSEKLITKDAKKAAYQAKATTQDESQFSMLKKLELPFECHFELKQYCEEKGIEFLSTAFDFESLTFLTNELKLKTLKIPSGEITNGPFLLAHAKTGARLILSTGMATLSEIEEALGVLAFGYLNNDEKPCKQAFLKAYSSERGQAMLQEKVTLLHCTSEYPAPIEEVNLKAMATMREAFKLSVGYSDHTKGINIPIAACSLGASIIEKHFTLDKKLPGPDHKASLNPLELKEMVLAIREIEKALGSGIKTPFPSELQNKKVVRKSLVAEHKIKAGEQFTSDNVSIKRPGIGLSPMNYWQVLEAVSEKSYQKDELIS